MSSVTSTVGFIAVRTTNYYGPSTKYMAIGTIHDDRADAKAIVAENANNRSTHLGHNEYGNSVDVCEVVQANVDSDLWDNVNSLTDGYLNETVLPEAHATHVERCEQQDREPYANADGLVQSDAEACQRCLDAALAEKGMALVVDAYNDVHVIRVAV